LVHGFFVSVGSYEIVQKKVAPFWINGANFLQMSVDIKSLKQKQRK
jgi:hypothetical protein